MTQLDILSKLPPAIQWHDDSLTLLDQTRLPLETVFEVQETPEQVWQSILQLKVRGAPAIGVAAAYGLCVAVQPFIGASIADFLDGLNDQAAYLNSSRPTAVNLGWALRRMQSVASQSDFNDSRDLYARLVEEAKAIHAEDIELCEGMARHGAPLIKPGMGVLTHCNAGSLATTGLGTATAPMYLAHANGVSFKVYADETRPLLQGARLTAWELAQGGIDVTLITDNMAAHMMATGQIDLVITGTDRVAANGDVANKIGTMGVAILADYFNIPFYVACPSSTIDFETPDGSGIPIEEREADEVSCFGSARVATQDTQVRNPAFDVTPNKLVAGLITEKGIINAPYDVNLKKMFV
ncbi:MAG: S-methyl-5-thioribose-1-phosphate isomerase [Robiginitomaculum sp.]|nr:MAG: S-methyl-5-thioribose-1-phosphate isomerase [Robiginitomaculum sp.]